MTGYPLPVALAAEELPTGLFGGPRPAPAYPAAIDPCAAEHVADLLAALDVHDADLRRAHLRVVAADERAAS
jgi:hypothetical protein